MLISHRHVCECVMSHIWMCHVLNLNDFSGVQGTFRPIETDGSRQATHCNTLQHTAMHCNTLQRTQCHMIKTNSHVKGDKGVTATHYNTLQHTATHCNTLQHTATHCNALQHPATHTVSPYKDIWVTSKIFWCIQALSIHVKCEFDSCHTCEWVLCPTHTHTWVQETFRPIETNRSHHACAWVMSHISKSSSRTWMCHVTHVNASCNKYEKIFTSTGNISPCEDKRVTSQIFWCILALSSHVTCEYVACHTCKWVMSHTHTHEYRGYFALWRQLCHV